jgi:hypothetical protein
MMFLLGIKDVCDGLISFEANPVILLTITFVKILKLTLSKHIGWYCLICEAEKGQFIFTRIDRKVVVMQLGINPIPIT